MKILFIHPYFPGQFKHLAQAFVARGWDVAAILQDGEDGRETEPVEGVKTLSYASAAQAHATQKRFSDVTTTFVRDAISVTQCAQNLQADGFEPDLIYTHAGWGTGTFIHDVFPNAKLIKFCEWYYTNSPDTTGFLNPVRTLKGKIYTSLLNTPILSDLANFHALIAPTFWQKEQFPAHLASHIRVIPDGIDCEAVRFNPRAFVELADGRVLNRNDRIITYVARGADKFRGFRQFMRALEIVQRQDRGVHAVIVGDRKSYYAAGRGEEHFDEVMGSVSLDPARTHFLGRVAYADYLKVLHVSSVHVYLTVPFVLSWSALEAMAAGCLVVGSDTPPVREFIIDGQTGFLCDFFDHDALSARILSILEEESAYSDIRRRAMAEIADRWSVQQAQSMHFDLINAVMALETPKMTGRALKSV